MPMRIEEYEYHFIEYEYEKSRLSVAFSEKCRYLTYIKLPVL